MIRELWRVFWREWLFILVLALGAVALALAVVLALSGCFATAQFSP